MIDETKMPKVFDLLGELKTKNIVADYMISGAYGAKYYLPPDVPIFTNDLDVDYIAIKVEPGDLLINVGTVWEYFTDVKKYPVAGQHIVIESIPTEFFAVVKGLEKEVYDNARTVFYFDRYVKVARPEHIIANYVKAGRDKDIVKIRLFLKYVSIDFSYLEDILRRHGLLDKFQLNKKRGMYDY